MRIGILTATRTDNNGTDLQALAMLNMFKKLGADNVELIDYVCDKIESSKKILSVRSIKSLLYLPCKLCIHRKHEDFRNKFLVKSAMPFTKETICKCTYDKIVVGSDQIWNLNITGGDSSFYLPFKKDGLKKYSYAASIGKTDINDWNTKYKLYEKLKDFRTVSVREESAVEALRRIGIEAKFDLDPILMGDKKDWTPIMKKRFGNYILLYLLDSNTPAWEYAQQLGLKFGWQVINCNTTLRVYKGINTLRCVGVEEWVGLVSNAQAIFTSSYHCISFAILFNRHFCFVPLTKSPESNQRMLNLVSRLGLEDCVFSPEYSIDYKIDWDRVNKMLKRIRSNSERYVRSIIND